MKYFKGDVKGKLLHYGVFLLNHKQMICVKLLPIHSKNLLEAGAIVKTTTQLLLMKLNITLETILYCEDQYETLIDADCLAILQNGLNLN
jgi:UDPglucose 6-dehydrogenase